MTVQPIPAGYHTITPYIIIEDTPALIDFMKSAFGGLEIMRMGDEGGKIHHAEVRIGDSTIMISGACERVGAQPCMLHLYVPDVDLTYERALAAGATSLSPPADQFYGDRSGGVKGPGGIIFWVATHIEDVSPEELGRRMESQPKQ